MPTTKSWISDNAMRADRQPWDLLVIGGGTAGLVAAKTAARLGASVLMIERARPGGDCLWTGCVPSKAFLAAAHAAADARGAARYGVRAEVYVDFAAVMRHVHRAIAAIEPKDSPDTVRATGGRVAQGNAVFTGEDRVEFTPEGGADSQTVRFRHCIIATGSGASMPPIPGLADVGPLTSECVWDLTELPRRLLVIGGGSIGCELGQGFARLGSQVTIAESAERLLGPEDARSAQLVHDALVRDGVHVQTGVTLEHVERDEHGSGRARFGDASEVEFDVVLVAAGRTPRTKGLGLTAAGVEVDERGHVIVDRHLRTSNARIYAAGDVTPNPKFTHVAGVHGSLAGSNAVLGIPRSIDPAVPPRVTFTHPELAAFGVSPSEAAADESMTVHVIAHDEVVRAIAEQRTDGLTQVVLDKRGRVVGASIVSPRAGESLAELVLAAKAGLSARDVASAMHAYPTFSDGVWDATIAQLREQLNSRAVKRATGLLAAIQRRRS